MNYYNENDPFAAQWLRNLIAAGLIPDGHVDERSIKEVRGRDVENYTQAHFFAGIGGWSEALRLAGWPAERQVWTGSCPCQPFSAAGKRKGTADERHLWPEFYRLIAECRPSVVFGEQVASKDGREWLAGIRADLEAVGHAVGAADLCAAGQAAPILRQRLWWVAESECFWVRGAGLGSNAATAAGVQRANRQWKRVRVDAGPGGSAVVDGMGWTNGEGSQSRREASEAVGHRSSAVSASSTDRLGGSGNSRLSLSEQAELSGAKQLQEGRAALQPSGAFWSDFQIVECSDGTLRRVGSDVQPLAHGIPASMGRGRTREQRMAIRAARTNRVGRLKGYGNAIVPQVAAEFIQAYLETVS